MNKKILTSFLKVFCLALVYSACIIALKAASLARKNNNRLNYEQDWAISFNDAAVRVNQKIREIDRHLQIESPRQTIEIDKHILFSKKCSQVRVEKEYAPEEYKGMLKLLLIQKYRTAFVNWCKPYAIDNFVKTFDIAFEEDIFETTNLLTSAFGEHYIECFIDTIIQARQREDMKEIDGMYAEFIRDGSVVSKKDFCEQVDTDITMTLTIIAELALMLGQLDAVEINTTVYPPMK